MENNQNNKIFFKNAFENLKTKEDLLDVLNHAKKLLYPNAKKIEYFDLKKLCYYSNFNIRKNAYKQFDIRKKNGGIRTILAPVKSLKIIQKCLNLIFNTLFRPSKQATGFVLERSVVTNAKFHVGKQYVYNIDLKDFFPSIQIHRVKAVLKISPFNLSDEIAFMIANLCCHNGVLPQGAPTSPTLSNIICQNLDKQLHKLAKQTKANYSRYADDITFSSDINSFKPNGKFNKSLKKIIKQQNFTINTEKTRLQNTAFRQEVTGLIVNEQVNVTRRYLRQIRAMLNNWQKLGLEQATTTFLQNYAKDKKHIKKDNLNFINVLSSKLEYLKMVRGYTDKIYLKYFEQYFLLCEKERLNLPEIINIENILNTWETAGIEKAMDLYYGNTNIE